MHGLDAKLQSGQTMVDAVFNQLELIVGTRLNHSSVGDHDNPIHVTHGGETVSDNKRGASSHQALERLLNQTFAFRVQGTGGLIQNKDGNAVCAGPQRA